MPLSEQEQRLLEEMERSLYANEADVVSTTPNTEITISPKSVVNAVLALAVGIGVVVLGLSVQQPLVGLLGFVILVGGIYWAFSGTGSAAAADAPTAAPKGKSGGTSGKSSPSSSSRSGQSFMDQMESRWNRRQDGQL
ncbi:DUF3040 domain-containing protein [Gulosibacter bifidus]|uniref:DUF3040 domain-containing protein n=1 Tax=Gulosibacter bifidus TaxID=272239 RepID=A0ABW5RGK5_9MICO|nr:DUF3040 domain-containing protein [Gulosibacter bifidus]